MTGKQDYAPPTSPPPNYSNLRPITQQDTGPHASSSSASAIVDDSHNHHQPYNLPGSPGAHMTSTTKPDHNNLQLQPYPNQFNETDHDGHPFSSAPHPRYPDQTYASGAGTFYTGAQTGNPPPQGYYGPGANANTGGYYGQPNGNTYYANNAYGMVPGQPVPVSGPHPQQQQQQQGPPWGWQQGHPQGPPPPMMMQPGWGPQPGFQPYYHDDRGMGGSGVCAGILGALACCCCLDMLMF